VTLRPTLLDRYVVREILPPTGLGLLLFTFVLLLDPITDLLRILVAKGADFATVLRAFLFLFPSILSVTIPMAFLLGVLLAFGRMASDSEIVALRASGVSPARLLRPVLSVSSVAAAATLYVVGVALPAANQAYREIVFSLAVSKATTGVKPRVFNDDLVRDMVVYVSDISSESGVWKDVFIHDSRSAKKPQVILARAGRLVIDRARRSVELDLQDGISHVFDLIQPRVHEESRFGSWILPLPYDEFFPSIPLAKGDREMSLPELRTKVSELKAAGRGRLETGRFEVEIHKKFAIPAACFVFGVLGLGMSLGSRKEARSAAFGLSIAVIFVYYVIIRLGEQAGDTGLLSPFLAMWAANLVLGAGAAILIFLNHREAAFDPLDPSHYSVLLPRIKRARRKEAPPEAPAPAALPRRVVVLKIPRWTIRFPGLIDRYIARAWTSHFLLVLLAFWSLFVLTSFMDLFDDVQQNRVKGKVVLHYYAFESPSILHLLTPLAVLVAVLITFGVLSRRNEITAMKAGGVSLYRVVVPVIGLSLLVSMLMFGLSELVLPPTKRIANQDHNVIKGKPPQTWNPLQRRWVIGSDQRFYNYEYLDASRGPQAIALLGLSVFDVELGEWRLRDRLYAQRAVWNGVSYDLEKGWRRSFGAEPKVREFTQVRTREIEPPSYFRQEERETETLAFADLRRHIDTLEQLGLDVVQLRVQLHRKLAYPSVALIMTLLGIPFSFVVARHGALYGVAASLMIAVVYWACLAIFEQLGNNAVLPALLAAWAPNILFGSASLYLMFTLDT
jgi:LPS export ABC transporter permease LptG/LPS export ABC transporter permease LptF